MDQMIKHSYDKLTSLYFEWRQIALPALATLNSKYYFIVEEFLLLLSFTEGCFLEVDIIKLTSIFTENRK